MGGNAAGNVLVIIFIGNMAMKKVNNPLSSVCRNH